MKDIRGGRVTLIKNLKYYLVVLSSMENISLKMESNFLTAIEKIMKRHHFTTKTEFIREAIRDKMRKLEEKEILEDKDLMAQIRTSERNYKKGKARILKY